jgi:hypothetical protein
MPVVGEVSQFAVEYDLNEKHGGEWMFGRFCFWCGGRRIGDYDVSTSLRDVLFQLDQVGRDRGRRFTTRFASAAARDIFRLLDGALFGTADIDNGRMAEEEQWARHNIFPPVDVFDRWKGFLVEDAQSARLVFSSAPYQEVSELALKPGQVDTVLDAARRELNNIHKSVSESIGRQ